MAACKDHQIFIATVLESLQILVLVAIIHNSFENELILSQGAGLIECHHVDSTTEWDLLGLADEDLLLLEEED